MGKLQRILTLLGLNRQVGYVTIANIVSASLGVVFWVIIANLLPTEEYGRYNYLVAVAAISSSIAILGLDNVITTYLPKGVNNIISQSNMLLLISDLIVCVMLFLMFNNVFVSVLAFSIVSFSISTAILLGQRSFKEYSAILVAQRIIQIPLSIILYQQIGINGILLGYAVAYFSLSYKFFLTLSTLSFNFYSVRMKWKLLTHSYAINIAAVLTTSADKIIIAPLFGFIILGYYQFAFQFFAFLSILPVILFQYLLPTESSGSTNSSLKKTGLVISIILSLVVILAGPTVVNALFPKFNESIISMQIISLAIIPQTIISILQSTMLSREKSKEIFLSAALYLTALIILITFLGTIFGLVGLAVALVASLCIEALTLLILHRKLDFSR